MDTKDIIKLKHSLSSDIKDTIAAMIPIASYCDRTIRNTYIETEVGVKSIPEIIIEERIYDTDEEIKDIIQNIVIKFWRALHRGQFKDKSPDQVLALLNSIITHSSQDYVKALLKNPVVISSRLPKYHNHDDFDDDPNEVYEVSKNYEDFVDYRDLWSEYNRAFLPQMEQLVSSHAFILRLKSLLQSLNDPLQRNSVIKRLIDQPDENDEFGILLNKVIKLSYDAGEQNVGLKMANSGRAQLIENADSHALDIAHHVRRIIQNGASTLQELADNLNSEGILTKNSNEWYASTVKLLLERINALQPDNPIVLSQDSYLTKMRNIINQMKAEGVNTNSGIASALNERNIPTKNGNKWYASTISKLLEKLNDTPGKTP